MMFGIHGSSTPVPSSDLLFLLLGITSLAIASPTCSDVIFQITASAHNYVFADTPDPTDELEVVRWMVDTLWSLPLAERTGTVDVTGTFNISGSFCGPESIGREDGAAFNPSGQVLLSQNDTEQTLQILVPGMTVTKEAWSCYGYSEQCSWQAHAASQGYYTLALDRLGSGASTRPAQAFELVQMPLHTEIMHQIIQAIRDEESSVLPEAIRQGPRFKRIVYAGYSYGAAMGTALALYHPQDIDALILAGFSVKPTIPGPILLMHFLPARHLPSKAQFMSLPVTYLTAATEATSTNALYHGDFNRGISALDWQFRDTVVPSELGSYDYGFLDLSPFTGPVLVVTGDEDAIYCDKSLGSCADVLKESGVVFPKARAYDYWVAPRTGHAILTQDSAPEVHRVVHEWLAEVL